MGAEAKSLPVRVGHVVDEVEGLVVDGLEPVAADDAELDVLNVPPSLEVDPGVGVREEGFRGDDLALVVDGQVPDELVFRDGEVFADQLDDDVDGVLWRLKETLVRLIYLGQAYKSHSW